MLGLVEAHPGKARACAFGRGVRAHPGKASACAIGEGGSVCCRREARACCRRGVRACAIGEDSGRAHPEGGSVRIRRGQGVRIRRGRASASGEGEGARFCTERARWWGRRRRVWRRRRWGHLEGSEAFEACWDGLGAMAQDILPEAVDGLGDSGEVGGGGGKRVGDELLDALEIVLDLFQGWKRGGHGRCR